MKSLSRHTLEQMVTLSSEAVLLVDAKDPNLNVVYVNPAYEDLSGYSAAELTGNVWPLLKQDGEGQLELDTLKAAIGRSEPCQAQVSDLRRDGTAWLSYVSVEPLYSPRGELLYLFCVQRPASGPEGDPAGVEISLLQRELRRARQQIASLDRVDPATGLMRFGYFQDLLRRDLAIARRDRRFVTLLLFDIVEFDAYRQTFGAKAADSCQRMIGAQIMRTLRRAGDLCTRYDDSTLIASVLGQQPHEISGLAERIAANVRGLGLHNPRAKSGRYVTVRSSIIGCPPGADEDAATIITRSLAQLRGQPVVEGGGRAALS